jgi:hypothetical protein
MEALISATRKFDRVEVIENVPSDILKSRLRDLFDLGTTIGEIFFYYTGHWHQNSDEFYICAPNFDLKRPNETGISSHDLHTFLRLANAELIVKVIDACNSGTQLIKSDNSLVSYEKHGFKNIIQISSCLESQNSLTGNPLSQFTESFRSAVLRKCEGIIYYTDIVDSLRDEYLENNRQTPFFVSQGTGRERFVDDATHLADLRIALNASLSQPAALMEESQEVSTPSIGEMLALADAKLSDADTMRKFMSQLFDGLKNNISNSDTSEIFLFHGWINAGLDDCRAKCPFQKLLSPVNRL